MNAAAVLAVLLAAALGALAASARRNRQQAAELSAARIEADALRRLWVRAKHAAGTSARGRK